MKTYVIKNDYDNLEIGYLIYYEIDRKFYVELNEDIDCWDLPIIFSHFREKGALTVDSYWSNVWVRERIVPNERQNIGQILRDNGLERYDEHELLVLGNGKSSQDDFFIEEVDKKIIFEKFASRMEYKVCNCIRLNDEEILINFNNGTLKKCNINFLINKFPRLSFIINDKDFYSDIEVQVGGYGIIWGSNVYIQDEFLFKNSVEVDINIDDIINILKQMVVNTYEASEILNCSRQNINDLIKRGCLEPIKSNKNNTLFLKNDILSRKWS